MSEPGGLYLHVPFCSRVCPYCDFAVRTGDRARRLRYVDHLLREIELYEGWPLTFDTIYFGGGTPSSLDAWDLGQVIEASRKRFRFSEDTRIFLEANPEDITPEYVAGLRKIGVDTISLGVQSLDPAGLEFLGRQHGPEVARRSVALAREVGFTTVSIDLIYGLPGQSPSDWREEMDRALELKADHISCYQLTIHQGTRFGLLEKRGKLMQLPNDEQAELFRLTHRHFNDSGMQGYEVSQFASGPEHRSRHNLKYWNHIPYLGLGPAAHSYHYWKRWWNLRRTDPWQGKLDLGQRPIEESETLDREALVLEALMTGLRTYAGVDFDRLRSRWGIDVLGANQELIERLQTQGLVSLEGSTLVPTLDGLAVSDSLAPMFEFTGCK